MRNITITIDCPAPTADGSPCEAALVLPVEIEEGEPMTRDYPGSPEAIRLARELPARCWHCRHEYTDVELAEMQAEAGVRMTDHAFDGYDGWPSAPNMDVDDDLPVCTEPASPPVRAIARRARLFEVHTMDGALAERVEATRYPSGALALSQVVPGRSRDAILLAPDDVARLRAFLLDTQRGAA